MNEILCLFDQTKSLLRYSDDDKLEILKCNILLFYWKKLVLYYFNLFKNFYDVNVFEEAIYLTKALVPDTLNE